MNNKIKKELNELNEISFKLGKIVCNENLNENDLITLIKVQNTIKNIIKNI
jgi:3-dehydroquinate dehydratase